MKKYGRHCLRRCLSVLLAVVMVCAAAQTLVFAVDLSGDDITPGWNEGSARARYTTSGTLEITFPESTKSDATYYAEFYDLDGENREKPVGNVVQLPTTRTYADDTTLVSAVLDRDWVENSGLDMSHRISVAVTAVSGGWRSEAIEALVGESLDVPASNASPDWDSNYVLLTDFDTTSNLWENPNKELTTTGDDDLPTWYYSSGSNGVGSVNTDGVFAGSGDDMPYQTPGFDGSRAFRLYVNGTDLTTDEDERIDIMYNQQHYRMVGAEELWIWVDTSYVEFEEFAIQIRYMDYTGDQNFDRDQSAATTTVGSVKNASRRYSSDSYSTIGYAKYKQAQGQDSQVPIYKMNDDGLWDVVYTNANGYLENFGHYRGFLRVPVDCLYNENYDAQSNPYLTMDDERPYTFYIDLGREIIGVWSDNADLNYLQYNGESLGVDSNIPASLIWDNPSGLVWAYNDWGEKIQEFDLSKFQSATGRNLSVKPIEDIASIGITWRGLSEDSVNKSFYIDHIGFSGQNLNTNDEDNKFYDVDAPLASFDMVPQDLEAVQALIEEYLPVDPNSVGASDAGIISDLTDICRQVNLTPSEVGLQPYIDALNNLLGDTTDQVAYVSARLKEITSIDESTALANKDIITTCFDMYQTFTLGDIHRLGLQDEAKLIQLYNYTGNSEWYPQALRDMYFLSFNEVGDSYTIGQTALHQYDNYVSTQSEDEAWYTHGHMMDYGNHANAMSGAWENTQNLLAYSRNGYWSDYSGNSTDYYQYQRFGYAATYVGQSGFENSMSIDTDVFRSALEPVGNADGEYYRIALTAGGQNATDYTDITPVDASGATYFAFYADFTRMTDISEIFVAMRDANYSIATNRGSVSTWQKLDLDDDTPTWEPVTDFNSLNGFRGFLRMPMVGFNNLNDTGSNRAASVNTSSIKQIKIFFKGNRDNANAAGSFFALDMFGFLSDVQVPGYEWLNDRYLATQLQVPDITVDNALSQFNTILSQLFTTVQDANVQLFDYSGEVYGSLIEAYNTMTLTEKEQADKELSTTSGEAYTGVDELQLFVKNYDEWNDVEGNLFTNAGKADALRSLVTQAFGGGSALADDTPGEIDEIFAAFDQYPAYYAHSVQTYWPDRNLHAVFPNYNPGDVVTTSPTVELTYDETMDSYVGSFDFNYVGAVGTRPDTQMCFVCEELQDNQVPLTFDDKAVQADVTGFSTDIVTGDQTQKITFTVKASDITTAGEYTGSLTIGVSVLPDSENKNIKDPDQYRDSFTLNLKLVSQAAFTIVIPADVQIPWGQEDSYPTSGLEMKDSVLPNGAHVDVSVENEDYIMTRGEDSTMWIPYTLAESDNTPFKNHVFEDDDTVGLDVTVTKDAWDAAPVIDEYSDTVVFTVAYVEQ